MKEEETDLPHNKCTAETQIETWLSGLKSWGWKDLFQSHSLNFILTLSVFINLTNIIEHLLNKEKAGCESSWRHKRQYTT